MSNNLDIMKDQLSWQIPRVQKQKRQLVIHRFFALRS